MTYDNIKFALAELNCEIGPAELHGCISGCICARRAPIEDAWIARLIDPEAAGHTDLDDVFRQMAAETYDQFLAGQFEYEPLLPDDDETLDVRIRALVRWTIGFLSGLGLAGFKASDKLPEDIQEVLVDLANLAQTDFAEVTGTQSEEGDFFEISEFAKVSALLLFETLQMPADPPSAPEVLH